jgi:branched-chain amino acid transport system permease protein
MSLTTLVQQLANGLSLGGVYALEAVGFGLIFNILKFSNFSHSAVVAISAYFGYFLSTRLINNFLVTLVITTLFGGIVGVVIEKLVFRPIRLKTASTTLFLVNSVTTAMLVQQFFSATLGSNYYAYPEFMKQTAFRIGEITLSKTYLIMAAASAVVLLLLSLFLKRTKVGIAIRASSTDIRTPSLMGINIDLVISSAFFFAGALGGITGYLIGMTYSVDPFIGKVVLKGIIASIIGGMGSLGGGVIAGLILGAAEALLIAEVGAASTPIVVYSAIILLLLVRPEGIMGKRYLVKA